MVFVGVCVYRFVYFLTLESTPGTPRERPRAAPVAQPIARRAEPDAPVVFVVVTYAEQVNGRDTGARPISRATAGTTDPAVSSGNGLASGVGLGPPGLEPGTDGL